MNEIDGRESREKRLVYNNARGRELLGIGRSKAYEAAKCGEIPTIRIGRRLLVPKAALHRMLEQKQSGRVAA